LFENGRRYHAYRQGKYILPNDEREQDRLDLVHSLFKEILDGDLYRAPLSVDKTQRILDLGTGTGNWAIEIAERFPDSDIIGTDLSPIQPVWSPSNCRFYVDDMESEWAYLFDEAFDYIHGRVMGGSIGDWDRFLYQIKDHLKPDGWVEFQEYETTVRSEDGTHERAKTLIEWAEKLEAASITYGKKLLIAPSLRQNLLDAGFVDVREDIYKVISCHFPTHGMEPVPLENEMGTNDVLCLFSSFLSHQKIIHQ
jgi:SAM-dependent methyltransferase